MADSIPPYSSPNPGSVPPPPNYSSSLPPSGDPGTSTGLTPNVAAGLACLLTLITGIIFLVLEKRNRFVRYWAMQATVFGCVMLAFNVLCWILTFIFGHIPVLGWIVAIAIFLLSLVVGLGALILYVIMLIKAFSGLEWDIPILGKIARQQLAKMDAGAGAL